MATSKSNSTKMASSCKPSQKSKSKSSPIAVNSCCCTEEFACDNMMLDDKTIISDVLGSQKALVKLYGTALCESSCNKLRTLVSKHMNEIACDQFDSFTYMSDHNMYPTDCAQQTKINSAKTKFNKVKSDL